MRRNIRLSGRKQLPANSISVTSDRKDEELLLNITHINDSEFKSFPPSAEVELRLTENKRVSIVSLGTLGAMKRSVVADGFFLQPMCQLRVVSKDSGTWGLLLGSTSAWRLGVKKADEKEQLVTGLLNFLPSKIRPRTWKLSIEEDVHPRFEVDDRIPDPEAWARSNTIFLGTVLPAILYQVFDDILGQEYRDQKQWMKDWLEWANTLMPGSAPPAHDETVAAKREWIDNLIDTFCHRHALSDKLVDELIEVANVK